MAVTRTMVITAPTKPVIAAATVRERLGLSSAASDANLGAFVAAVTGMLDGPDGWLGRALGPQTLELQADHFPGNWGILWRGGEGHRDQQAIDLLCPPIVSITSVTYLDTTGTDQTLDPLDYVFDNFRALSPAYGTVWPLARIAPQSVRIRYVAGYPDGAVPAAILQAIVMQVAAMNSMTKADPQMTQDTVIGVSSQAWATSADIGAVYDRAASALLQPFRLYD